MAKDDETINDFEDEVDSDDNILARVYDDNTVYLCDVKDKKRVGLTNSKGYKAGTYKLNPATAEQFKAKEKKK